MTKEFGKNKNKSFPERFVDVAKIDEKDNWNQKRDQTRDLSLYDH